MGIAGWAARPAGTMRFAAQGAGTRVDLEMALNPLGLMVLLSPLIDRRARGSPAEHLARFKDILEHF